MNFFDDCIKAIDSILEEDEYDKYYDAFNKYEKIIVLGNGGSNSLASHIAQDYTKRADKRAMSFSDPSMLTCYMNDYGVENSYMEFLKDYADLETLVILVSSSGNSANIVKATEYCEAMSIPYGVLTAFDPDNKVRTLAKNALFSYYIDTHVYGVAECVHQIFLHAIVEHYEEEE